MIDGGRIKVLMKEQGITSKELADVAGVSEAMICYILRGQRDTTVRVMSQIAKRLGVTVDELLKGEG